MKTEARKAAIAAYKETKSTPGIFALRCTATGAAWVGRAADLATIRNRLTFTLARGAHNGDDFFDSWWVGRVAPALVSRRAARQVASNGRGRPPAAT